MTSRLQTLDDVRQALAEQNRRLRAAYDAMPPGRMIEVPLASLRALADRCDAWRSRPRSAAKIAPIARGVRC
ncbi:MAG TPA: hypothetical protein VK841_12905 [Polyangiaceae bacterium]|jgi:hypothetical protein|nr:hypothetical protein [Polyangiaceae bacterium]